MPVTFDDLIPGQQAEQSLSFEDLIPVQSNVAAKSDAGNVDEIAQRGDFIPLGRTEGGELTVALPAFIEEARQAIADVMTGRRQPRELTGSEVFAIGGVTSPVGTVIRQGGHLTGPLGSAARTARETASAARVLDQPVGELVGEAAQRLDVDLPRAVTSDTVGVQQFGRALTNIPGGGTPLRRASEQAIEQLGQAATRLQRETGAGSPQTAGAALRDDITNFAGPGRRAGDGGVGDNLAEQVSQRYERLESMINQNTQTQLSNTERTIQAIQNSRTNAGLGESPAVNMVIEAATRPTGLNFQGTRELRTAVGELLDGPPTLLPANTRKSELKQIFGALSDDLENAARNAGGDPAVRQFRDANNFAAKVARERKELNRVVRPQSDEGVFDGIVRLAGQTSRADIANLRRARSAVSSQTWSEVQSAVISRLGRDADGNFSPDRFVTGFGRLSAEGRSALFGGEGNLRRSLEDLANVSRRFKRLQQFSNPSGTAQSVIGPSLVAGALADPLTTLGTVLVARTMAAQLARPAGARQFADWSRAYENFVRNPTRASRRAFRNRTGVLSTYLATELGDAARAARINDDINAAVGQTGSGG